MREGQKRVNVYIPEDLYSRVLNSEYNITEAIITGLTKLLEPAREGFGVEIDTSTKEDSNALNTELVMNLQNQVKILEERLSKTPDPSELEHLQVRTEEQKVNIEEYKVQVQTLNSEIARLKDVIMEAPDPIELAKLQERNEGLNLVIAEKDRSIERLEKEVNRLDLFSHYFKSNQPKQIEAPAAEKVKPWWKFW